jgi:glutamyl-tRNA synthetase
VLIRADGTFLYTFTSVVDDIDFAITHIIRGEDHVTNTGVQIGIFEALGSEPPAFGHHSLLVGADGQALAKRLGALSAESFRALELEPMAVLSMAALLGTSDAIEPHARIEDLAALFDPAKISTAPGRFDLDELKALNAKLLHKLPYADVAARLQVLGVGGASHFWDTIRGNIGVLKEAADWWRIATADIAPVIENADLCARSAALLPHEPWDECTWGAWTALVKDATGAKGRGLFHPLRLALTGHDSGPELKHFLPFIGRERAAARLEGRVG